MGERAINLNQQLNYIEQLFSSGQIKKAQKDLRKLNTQFGRDKPIHSKDDFGGGYLFLKYQINRE